MNFIEDIIVDVKKYFGDEIYFIVDMDVFRLEYKIV